MQKRPGGYYHYIMVAFSLVVLGWSIWAIYSAFSLYQQGNQEQFYVYMIFSTLGFVLGLSSLAQMRRRFALLRAAAVKVLATVICGNCGFKVIRNFSPGDFVLKEVGKCQQCSGTTRVEAIYAEEPKSS